MLNDVRLGFRSLAKTPTFTAIAMLLLALGVGGTVAVFSIVDAVLLKALPYPDADRIVTVWESTDRAQTMAVSAPNFRDWRQSATSFSALAAWEGGRSPVLGGAEPVVTGVYGVTSDFFSVFGVSPAKGRGFTSDEVRENGTPAVVVSHALWTGQLGGTSDLAARPLRVEGMIASVVGVMPDGFEYPAGAEVWFPLERFADDSGRTAHNLRVVARLKPETSEASAQAEMTTIAQRLEATYKADHDGVDARVIPLHERLVAGSRQLLLILLGGVGMVLLATCANVANMVIARGTGRQRELAVRKALGAARGRLVRLLLVENAVLAAGGVLGGVAAVYWIMRGLVAVAPASVPRLDQVALDARTALVAAGLALVTPIVFGLLPSLQLSRAPLSEALAAGGRTGSHVAGGRMRQGLVALEVAVALLLVTGAGLLGRSMRQLLDVQPGFDATDVVTAVTTLPADAYPEPAAAARFYATWLERVSLVPGVARAGLINAPPLSGLDADGGFMFDGQNWDLVKGNWIAQSATYSIASDGYFEAMGIPIRRGRVFNQGDAPGREAVAVINEALARKHFAGRDPLGARLRFAGMDRVNPWLTIVGVVGDVRSQDLSAEAVPEVFVSYRQQPERTLYFVTTAIRLRPGVGPESVAPVIRDTLRSLEPNTPVQISSMVALIERSTASRRFTMTVVGAFGLMALVLAAIGVYGILSYTVAQRTREIGIRMALGAPGTAVAALVFRMGAAAVAVGVTSGIVAASGLTRLLRSFLFGVTPLDPVTFAASITVVVAVSWLAAWQPARRASRIDPAVVMRMD